MSDDKICPVCGEGTLIPHEEEVTFSPMIRNIDGEFQKAEYEITMIEHFSACDTCFSQVVNLEQSRLNKEQILAEKAKYEKED